MESFICPKFIFKAVTDGVINLKKSDEQLWNYLHSYNFVKLIFAVSEAARFEVIRTSLVIGVAMSGCTEKEKIKLANDKNLYNVSSDMVMAGLLNFTNYTDLKKCYGNIISYGSASNEKEMEDDAKKKYASINMSQKYLGDKYKNPNHANKIEIETYRNIGLIK